MASATSSGRADDGAPAVPGPRPLAAVPGLRAVAALSILFLHATFLPIAARKGPTELIAQLQVGVPLFFALSGLLLYRPYVRAHLLGAPSPELRPYFLRRLVRLFPAYWVCLIVTVIVLDEVKIHSFTDWLMNLTLTQVYSRDVMTRSLPQTWTLCLELAFYAFLPFYAVLVRAAGRRVGPLRAEVAGVGLLWVVGMAYQFAFATQDAYLPWVLLPEFFPVFAVGIGYAVASAYAATAPEEPGWAQRIARRASWAWLVAPLLMLLSADRYGDYGIVTGGVRSRSIEFVGMLVALCLVMPVVFVAARPGPVRRFLAWRPMVEIGVLSYGIYLWHFPLIEWFWDNLTTPPREPLTPTWYLANPWWTLAFAFASAVTIASLSWYGLERPLMNRARGRPATSS